MEPCNLHAITVFDRPQHLSIHTPEPTNTTAMSRPFSHLPPDVAQTVLRVVAPHVLPIWRGNNRIRVIPRQASWSGELSGLPTYDSLPDLLKALGHKWGRGPVVFTNPKRLAVNAIDRILRDNRCTRVVYVVK